MKNFHYITGITLFFTSNLYAQYTHPTTGINGEYVGSCLVTDCGPFTYTDNGGAGSNYSNSINAIYRVFCPNTAGNCMRVTFNSFNAETNWDYLTVGNGPTQNSTLFTTPPATAAGRLTGNLNLSAPFTYTSTDASGCLTFRFTADGSINRAGWDATLQCVPCAGGPNGTDNNDCQTLTALCSSAAVASNSTGPGIVAEGCTGSTCPAGGENHTNWYQIQIATSGNLNITITPNTPTDDYDFAIFGPNVTCGALGAPIRCTDSGLQGITGTSAAALDNTEDVMGDSFVRQIAAIAGETYIIVVDKWSGTGGTGYNMSFGSGPGSASLDCVILPVELTEFTADYIPADNNVELFWSTASERDNDRWDIEHSIDGVNYSTIHTMKGAGTTADETQYFMIDNSPSIGVNYYRLNQWDINGNGKYSEVRAVNVLSNEYDMLSAFPNPTNGDAELVFNSYKKESVLLTVQSYDGKNIIHTPIDAVKGTNRYNLNLEQQSKGLYIISVTSSIKTYTTKLYKN